MTSRGRRATQLTRISVIPFPRPPRMSGTIRRPAVRPTATTGCGKTCRRTTAELSFPIQRGKCQPAEQVSRHALIRGGDCDQSRGRAFHGPDVSSTEFIGQTSSGAGRRSPWRCARVARWMPRRYVSAVNDEYYVRTTCEVSNSTHIEGLQVSGLAVEPGTHRKRRTPGSVDDKLGRT